MEGEGRLLKEASLSLQTSHTLRELPPRAPALTWQRVVSLCMMRVLSGEVFSFWEVEIWSRVRLRARFEGGMRREKSGRGAPCGLRPCRVRNLSKMLRCRERPMCRSGLGERYLLTTMEYCTRVRHHFKSHPACHRVRLPHSATDSYRPKYQKLPPCPRHSLKAKQIFVS